MHWGEQHGEVQKRQRREAAGRGEKKSVSRRNSRLLLIRLHRLGVRRRRYLDRLMRSCGRRFLSGPRRRRSSGLTSTRRLHL